MATGTTEVADIIVPEVFGPYFQNLTEEKSRMVRSGAVVRDSILDAKLSAGGLTYNEPSFNDLDNDDDNVSSDTGAASTPKKISTAQEIQVRLSRNQSWAGADLAADLAGADPVTAIGNRVAGYWDRKRQIIFVSTVQGVFADNDAAPTGTDTHTAGDLTHDISDGAYTPGVTDFSADGIVDALVTMGDSMENLRMMMIHSIVYARMIKQDLIDFIPDSEGKTVIPTFLGRIVVVDDGVPNPAGAGAAATAAGIYHSWLFGAGAFRLGSGAARKPVGLERDELANNGGGEETLTTRVELCLHPVGHAYIGTAANGGPSNAATTNNLAAAASWSRVWNERKQIRIARLITKEA